MKKIILYFIVIIIYSFFSVYFYFRNIEILEENITYYEYFKNEKLIGVDGEINLSGIIAKKNELNDEVITLFNKSTYDYNIYLSMIKQQENSNQAIQSEINNLSKEISDLDCKKKNLTYEYDILQKKYNSMNNNLGNSNNKYKFPLINQYPKYPTGCESVALTMLLQYYGISVTADDVIYHLKKGNLPYLENSKLYGGNPEIEFIGNPYSSSSYGVYEKPIANVANIYKNGIQIKNNFPFSEVVSIVKNGTPVMVWTSMGLSLPYISKNWIYKPTMETIYWKSGEHAVVIVDATDTNITIADPIGGTFKVYSYSLFEQRYNYFGKKALYYL